jgi:hypothetical protein
VRPACPQAGWRSSRQMSSGRPRRPGACSDPSAPSPEQTAVDGHVARDQPAGDRHLDPTLTAAIAQEDASGSRPVTACDGRVSPACGDGDAVLLRRPHGSRRSAAALATRRAEAEALIAGATELEATGGSWNAAVSGGSHDAPDLLKGGSVFETAGNRSRRLSRQRDGRLRFRASNACSTATRWLVPGSALGGRRPTRAGPRRTRAPARIVAAPLRWASRQRAGTLPFTALVTSSPTAH